MNPRVIIAQLKAHPAAVAMFIGRIFGAGQLNVVFDQMNQPNGHPLAGPVTGPTAYVVPRSMEGGENESMNGYRQDVTERFEVVVAFDNRPSTTGERLGFGVTDAYDPVNAALFKSLVRWNPDPDRSTRGIQFDGVELIPGDKARSFYGWSFSYVALYDDDDAWQDTGDAIEEIDLAVDLTLPADGTPDFSTKITFTTDSSSP